MATLLLSLPASDQTREDRRNVRMDSNWTNFRLAGRQDIERQRLRHDGRHWPRPARRHNRRDDLRSAGSARAQLRRRHPDVDGGRHGAGGSNKNNPRRNLKLPLPSGEVDVSLRASGEGACFELNAGALTRAGGASSPKGRGNEISLPQTYSSAIFFNIPSEFSNVRSPRPATNRCAPA